MSQNQSRQTRDQREIERATHPVLMLRQVGQYKALAVAAFALLSGGFGVAVWLHVNFATQREIDHVRVEQKSTVASVGELSANVNKLTNNVAGLTAVVAASGKLQDDMRHDIKDLAKDIRIPVHQRSRVQRLERPSVPSFDEVVESVQHDMGVQ